MNTTHAISICAITRYDVNTKLEVYSINNVSKFNKTHLQLYNVKAK